MQNQKVSEFDSRIQKRDFTPDLPSKLLVDFENGNGAERGSFCTRPEPADCSFWSCTPTAGGFRWGCLFRLGLSRVVGLGGRLGAVVAGLTCERWTYFRLTRNRPQRPGGALNLPREKHVEPFYTYI